MAMARPNLPPRRWRLGLLSGCILLTLLIWAALLFRMVASSPSAPSAHHGPPPCASTPRVLWAPRVVLHNEVAAAAVHIDEIGHIVAAWPCSRNEAEDYAEVRALTLEAWEHDEVISPGLVDAAAHLAEWLEPPGRSYEGFSSGTQAAAAGGVTTVIDLPAHARPLTTSAASLHRKVEATRGRLHTDVGFWGAALPENVNADALRDLLHHGALGLTAVVAASPSVEQPGVMPGTRALTLAELEVAIDAAAASNKPVLVHAEVVSDDDAGLPAGADGMDYASWLATRPLRWEEGAVRAILSLAAKAKPSRPSAPRIHVLRLTDAGCTPLLNAANAQMEPAVSPEGVSVPRVTAGSCPHYMMFDAESVVRGDTRLKVAPPLRDASNRRKLWSALLDGTVSMLASDHTPATLEERAGSFFDAFTGISGLQFTLPATWTEGREHGASLTNLSRWLSEEVRPPARDSRIPPSAASRRAPLTRACALAVRSPPSSPASGGEKAPLRPARTPTSLSGGPTRARRQPPSSIGSLAHRMRTCRSSDAWWPRCCAGAPSSARMRRRSPRAVRSSCVPRARCPLPVETGRVSSSRARGLRV